MFEELAARFLDELDVDVPDEATLDAVILDVLGWGLEPFQLAPLLAGAEALRTLLREGRV